MKYDTVLTETSNEVHRLAIHRPEVGNKLNIQCMEELTDALKAAEADRLCRAIIITGSGEYFCGGGELGDYRAQSSMQIREFGKSFIRLHLTITGLSKPVIAAVQGPALGGGFNLVEACDLAVASEEATFGVPEIHSGLAPMMALTGVSRSLHRKGVLELALFGEAITARRALEIGLVNLVCDKEKVLEKSMEYAKKLAQKNPTAVSLCKKLYGELDAAGYERQLECGLNMLVALLKSDDAREAFTAREENRSPQWKNI
jgi:enoyl-CoA hydratase/carnithine racemase